MNSKSLSITLSVASPPSPRTGPARARAAHSADADEPVFTADCAELGVRATANTSAKALSNLARLVESSPKAREWAEGAASDVDTPTTSASTPLGSARAGRSPSTPLTAKSLSSLPPLQPKDRTRGGPPTLPGTSSTGRIAASGPLASPDEPGPAPSSDTE